MEPLHGIAFCLSCINISILEDRDRAHEIKDYSIFSSLEASHMNSLITEDEYREGYPTPANPMDNARGTRLAEYIRKLPREEIIQFIRDPKALPYVPKLFENRLLWWENWMVQKRMVENDLAFIVPTQHRGGKSDYTSTCLMQSRLWRQRLRDLRNITLQLRKYAVAACSPGLLDDISMRRLKAKMNALQQSLPEVCDVLGYPKKQLVWNTKPW